MSKKDIFCDGMFCTVDEVINFTGVKTTHLNLSKDDEPKLIELVTNWIRQATSLIKAYCHNDFADYIDEFKSVPIAVNNVCMRLTANMVSQAIARRDTPITKVNDWNISTVGSRIFTNDLKEDLAPWKIENSNNSVNVNFFAITGDKPHGKAHHYPRRNSLF
jgi:hypothetical protein